MDGLEDEASASAAVLPLRVSFGGRDARLPFVGVVLPGIGGRGEVVGDESERGVV